MPEFKISNSIINIDTNPYFIADIAANHDGDINRAFKLIELAKESGADAAKFQHFQASKIVSDYGFSQLGSNLSHQKDWNKSVFQTYEDASVPFSWTEKLYERCLSVDINFMSTPYDFESIDHLDPYVDVYKIGSGDITWLNEIEYIASKRKPIILATGASSFFDVQSAVDTIAKTRNPICLMQCNTNYTADKSNFKYINLNVLKLYEARFPEITLGLSDHTIGFETVLGAIPLGARVIEKHFTDDTFRKGPDHKFSMDSKSWREMVNCSQNLFKALGDGIKKVELNEQETVVLQRRSIRVIADFPVGHRIGKDDIEILRPCPTYAISASQVNSVIGTQLAKPISKNDYLTDQHFNQ